MPDRICLIQTSVETPEQARSLGEQLLSERLAACVQVIPAGTSLFHWQGAIEQSAECYLAIKTRPELRERATRWLEAHHPYEVPEILWTELGSSAAYARWLQDETQPHGGGTS